jgi:hypothetical protein
LDHTSIISVVRIKPVLTNFSRHSKRCAYGVNIL